MELDQVSEDRIADILIVLSEVSCSNFTTRLPELEESDVFSTLYAAINEMAATLADAHERTERYQNELAEKITTIEEQRVAIRELSTPVIEVMDTGTADHFLRAARAVRLLGTDCVLTGISPSIAQTIVHMGAELSGLTTYRSLRDALKEYNRTRSALWATSPALPQGPSVNGRPPPSDRSTSR